VEYHVEQDMVSISSGSDFEDEIVSIGDSDESEVPEVITAEDEVAETITVDVNANVVIVGADHIEPEAMLDNVLVPDDSGVITQVMTSPRKRINGRKTVLTSSEVMAGSSQVINVSRNSQVPNIVHQDLVLRDTGNNEERGEDYTESKEDSDYVAHSDDSGEESEVVNMRKKAKQFKRKMRASQRWVEGENATEAVPIDLVANVEEVSEEINKESEFESSDEDYSYDEEEEGNLVRRKSRYPRFDPESEAPHFCLPMVFRSRNQLVNAIKKIWPCNQKESLFQEVGSG
jgi:hypothetical protein